MSRPKNARVYAREADALPPIINLLDHIVNLFFLFFVARIPLTVPAGDLFLLMFLVEQID